MTLIAAQPDLFGEPRLAGLSQAGTIVTPAEERALIEAINATELSLFRFHGWLGKRLTISYGWRYDFEDASFALSEAIPDWLLPLRERAARFAGLQSDELARALLIRYDPGAGIGWHRDRPVFEHVLGISLGAPATMRFRRHRPGGFDRTSLLLMPRSIYHRSGEARHEWEHSIAPMEATCWSITFVACQRKGRAQGMRRVTEIRNRRHFASEGYPAPPSGRGRRTPGPRRRPPANFRGPGARVDAKICRPWAKRFG